MIRLITGAIGSGKTLFACSNLTNYLNEYDLIYCNIEGIQPLFFWSDTVDNLIACDIDYSSDAMMSFIKEKSYDTSVSKLFIIDEAAFYFLNDKKQLDKEFLKFMAYSRHYGADFVFICQEPAQLHYQLRHLVNEHIHLRRKWGTGLCTVLRKQGIIYETQNSLALREQIRSGDILSSRWFIKKKYFDAYTSALTFKHQKYQIPLGIYVRAFIYGLPIIAFILYLNSYISNFRGFGNV